MRGRMPLSEHLWVAAAYRSVISPRSACLKILTGQLGPSLERCVQGQEPMTWGRGQLGFLLQILECGSRKIAAYLQFCCLIPQCSFS